METKSICELNNKETDIAITLNLDGSWKKQICLPASDFLTICWMALRDTAFLI